jgi:hypothetical protein
VALRAKKLLERYKKIVMLEFSTLMVRFPEDCELLSLRFVKTQLWFTKDAEVKEPFKAKLIVLLSSGMLNLSEGMKVVAV